jgi:NADH dehydrogenase FAD-containing subunit
LRTTAGAETGWRRRGVIAGLGAGAALLAGLGRAPAVRGQGKPRLVVIGGGAGGLSVAQRVAAGGGVAVTVVEANPRYLACFWSNHVLGGLEPRAAVLFDYTGVRAAGIEVVQARATAVDRDRQEVRTQDGGRIAYDRLVMAPGVGFRDVPGYDAAARQAMPHAYDADPRGYDLLMRQLRDMPDGGKVLLSVPSGPYRCPPAPYERVSMIAHYLKQTKPNSRIQVIDAKNQFLHQAVTQNAWNDLYPGMVEWLPADFIGQVREVDAGSKTLKTDFEAFTGDVVNFIPPQQADRLARATGLTDAEGFCPVEFPSMRSERDGRIFVVGDAIEAHSMPKAATAAVSQARSCAGQIRAELVDAAPPEPRLDVACYSFLDARHAVINTSVYRPTEDGGVERVSVQNSDAEESAEVRRDQAARAKSWYRGLTRHLFG